MFTKRIEKSHVEPKIPIILLNYEPSHFNDMLHLILKILFVKNDKLHWTVFVCLLKLK